jgi:Flp pilus assembly pilin Flp
MIMQRFSNMLKKFVTNDEGAAMAEYAILVAFIAIVAIVAVTVFGKSISAKFAGVATSLS